MGNDYGTTASTFSQSSTSKVLETGNENAEICTTFLSSSDYSSKLPLECSAGESSTSSNGQLFVNKCRILSKRSHDVDDDGRNESIPKKIMKKSLGGSITRNDLKQTSVKHRLYSDSLSDYSSKTSGKLRNISSDEIKTDSLESAENQISKSSFTIQSSECSSKNNDEKSIDDLTVLYSSLENNSISSKPSSIEEALKAFICMGKKVANAISDTLKLNDEALLFKSSNFEKKCLSVVHALACRSRDLEEEDMEKILKLLDEEQNERKLFRETFLESLRVSHLTNMALYNQVYRLLKTF